MMLWTLAAILTQVVKAHVKAFKTSEHHKAPSFLSLRTMRDPIVLINQHYDEQTRHPPFTLFCVLHAETCKCHKALTHLLARP